MPKDLFRPQLGEPHHYAYVVEDIEVTLDRLVDQLALARSSSSRACRWRTSARVASRRSSLGVLTLALVRVLKPERRETATTTDIKHLDITRTNIAVQELIERTENPRHRYLLQAYDRHRNLEHAARFEEIFSPEMTVEHPVYRFNMMGPAAAHRSRAASRWSRSTASGQKPTSPSSTTRMRRWQWGTGWSSARWWATSRRWAPCSPRAGWRPTRMRCTSSGAGSR